ncbi:MAG: trehalose-phosphatase [Herbiconiux sp.]|uniref:trehalose-phosphatase n=1 Tax=Herbiconiux sp. TaxID=1871186 RepID=UPI0011FC78D0|nr:trehalose-phosphatase [Herbiconiux sp.]TAJ49361.1 MAG: trehalose-phosphatase [Herbiconiux sp.]
MSEHTNALDVDSELLAQLERLAGTPELLVALDFDGTLSPEVDTPDDARALPEARAAVLELMALPHTRVALVSGRAMESLLHVSELPDEALLIGSHGVEERLDAPVRLALSDEEKSGLARLHAALDAVADDYDGVWVEHKPAGYALHTRRASESDRAAAQERARTDAATAASGLTVRLGKNVLEFSVRGTTKGDAVRVLREFTGATGVLFAGDDVTDEDGFAALGADDFGLKAGPGATVAAHRVDGPREVASVLQTLANLRAGTSA